MASTKNLPVTAEDQQSINRYSYLIYRSNRIAKALEQAESTVSSQVEALEELDSLELECDDEPDYRIPVFCGNAYFHLPLPQARLQAQKVHGTAQSTSSLLSQRQEEYKTELAELKRRLESKYGDAIRLE